MTTTTRPAPRSPLGPLAEPRRLTSWSWWMLAVFVVAYLLSSYVGAYLVFPLLGLKEGDIFLFARNAGGWAAASISWLLLIAGPVAGVVLAVRARRLHAGAVVWPPLLLNTVALLFTAYLAFDEIRMTYFPGFTFPFPG